MCYGHRCDFRSPGTARDTPTGFGLVMFIFLFGVDL